MTKEEFLVQFQDVLQKDDAVNENDVLETYEEWDSMSKMAVMAYFKQKFNVSVSLPDLGKLKTVSDVIALAGDKIQ